MKARIVLILFAVVLVALPSFADARSGPVGKMTVSSAAVEWQASGTNFDHLVLVVSSPDGSTFTREVQGSRATFRPSDLAPRTVVDGTYTYELRAIPKISDEVKQQLAAARAADDDAVIAKIKAEAGIGEPVVQSGAFMILNGSFVTDRAEPAQGKVPHVEANATGGPPKTAAPNLIVVADDESIQGSLCVGLDCTSTESFGFDTLRLKENNTRIKFQDTSTAQGFPNNVWQLTANDSNSGGLNKFSIDDITGSKTPFTTIAGAPSNSLFIASSGKVGFGNNAPGLNLHITATDTPAIRQEQTSGGGFTAQTWDIGANEANWFVRDLTGGSRLPLRIRPGAPTSSIDIQASGFVGIGTSSASFPLDLVANSNTPLRVTGNSNPGLVVANAGTTEFSLGVPTAAGNFVTGSAINDVTFRSDGGGKMLFSTSTTGSTNGLTISGINVGIGTSSPTAQLSIVNGASSSTINAGSSTFTVSSSRTFKENIAPVSAPNILDKIEAVPVVTYDFINNGPKDRMGLIAEDFYKVFGRGDDKHIDGQDVQMALWLAVQKLTAQNKELTDRLATLEKELQQKQ